jgi:hypothetical protein
MTNYGDDMLKNISFLALAGALAFATSMTGCIVVTDDGNSTAGDTGTAGDGDGDTAGDGDGDGDTATTGDGDGDGDTAGDGDGDGDGDTAGDGDGDPVGSCGWDDTQEQPGYYCGGMGEDPGGTPSMCPDGLVEGEPCGELTGAGCCDANGDNWYCADDGMGQYLFLDVCS